MDFKDLKLNRFGARENRQDNGTKDSVYASVYPTPKQIDEWKKIGQGNKSNEEDRGAPNIITGTVITSCFIQTTALPSRVEMAGNDITFFDDTVSRNGRITGDLSRIIWTYASAIDQSGEVSHGFIMSKRCSTLNTFDNVFNFYALPAETGKMNYMFFGIEGRFGNTANVNQMSFVVNYNSQATTQAAANGKFIVAGTTDGVNQKTGISFFNASSDVIPGLPEDWHVFLSGYGPNGAIFINSTVLPNTSGINFGTPLNKFGTFYGSVSACPLPTVENALTILDAIPDPTIVGDRGHYGNRKYFDDLTMPKELLWTNSDGHVDIEHNHMIGFLLKVVKELKSEIDALKAKV